jgi:hypothetical protein
MKRKGVYFAGFVLGVLLISLVSAGIFDSLKGTGKASYGNQDVSIRVQGTNPPTIDPISSIANQNPFENGIRTVTFNFSVTDPDGVANLNDSSIIARVSRGATIITASCNPGGNVDFDTRRYLCSVDMQYYNSAGAWDLYVEAKDQEANVGSRTVTGFFIYTLYIGMNVPLSPASLNWPNLAPGQTNVLSNNDPTIVTNTGNYAGNIFITAYDLQGETTGTEYILASSFSVDSATGGIPPSECNIGSTAVALSNGTSVDTGIGANPGLAGSANIYYCVTSVPLVSSQIYSTSIRGPAYAWTIAYQ